MSYDIVTCGSATVDVFVKTKVKDIDIKEIDHGHKKIMHLIGYPTGAKILIDHLEFMTGGGGTNTAVSFSRLGMKTAYLGKLADDINGKKIKRILKNEKISFVGKTSKKEMTGYSVILDSKGNDRTILTYKGTNNNLRYTDVPKFRCSWLYFSSMVGNSFKTMERVAKVHSTKGTKIAFNPSNYQAKKGKKFLGKMLKLTDVLILNKEEASLLLKNQGSIKDLLKGILACGPKIAVITDGSKGAYCTEGINIYSIKPRKTKIVETTGAGDAFASGFVTGLKKKEDISYALNLGMENARSVISHYGAKNKLLTFREASKLIKNKVIIRKL